MNVILDFTVVPIGVGVSLSKYVAECQRVLDKRKIKYQLHANGTNVEGEWDDVFSAIKECHEAVHKMGAPRISTVIKVGTRIDKSQSMDDKIKSVEEKL
ncbi:MAG: MTH1187 family thiamine-binding protein [Ignavibacteria bacterium]